MRVSPAPIAKGMDEHVPVARGISAVVGSQARALGPLAMVLASGLTLGCTASATSGNDTGNGSDASSSDDGGATVDDASDAGAGDAADGAPSTTYPAFAPDMPQIVDHKGARLNAAKIVTVTFAGDPNTATIQAFDDAIGASKYWKTTTSEYGIGPASSAMADHVVVQTAPMSPWADSAIDSWVATQAGSSTSGWPAPDAQTVYAVFIPASVQVTSSGQDACQSYDGYHTELQVGTDPNVAYALILEKCMVPGTTMIDNVTETAAHELVESATDPVPDNSPGLTGFDADHLAWELWNQWSDEVADACQNDDDANYREGADLPYAAQRTWSNVSAKAGHDPCVPVPSGPFFDVTPLGLDDVTVSAPNYMGTLQTYKTKGWHVVPGMTRTVQIGLYSDAPTGDWTLTAVEGNGFTSPSSSALDLSLSQSTGNNGTTVDLTIRVKSAPTGGTGVLATIISARGNLHRYMPVLVGAY
jgi:hypothetical protein